VAQPAILPSFPATERDLDGLPEGVKGQIIDGELVVLPRPGHPHLMSAAGLSAILGGQFLFGFGGGPGGWIILAEPEIRFGRDLLIPDLAGWRKERFAAPRKGPYVVSLDWVCEILSPTTVRIDRVRKLSIYAREHVGHAWLIDPLSRTLEVFSLHEERWLLVGSHQDDEKVRAQPFAAVEIDLSLLWTDIPEDAEEGA